MRKNLFATRKLSNESQLMAKIRGSRNSYDHAEGDGGAGVMPVVTDSGAAQRLVKVGPGRYNPPFKAQIQIQIKKLYFTEAAGTYTPILPAAILAAGGGLPVTLPFFLFLNSDWESGYSQLQTKFPQAVWGYNAPVVYGKDQPITSGVPLANGKWDANVTALLRNGDVVFPFTATVGGTRYVALVVVRAADVAYASLLGATNSNTFSINMIRYKVVAGQETQFANTVLTANETMFGKVETDPINPESFQNPEQNQDNIIDMDVEIDVNKQKGIASATNYDVVTMTWNIFIASASKIV